MKFDGNAFLLGPGRSGTTLLYKLLAAHPDVGYFSNYHAKRATWTWLALMHRSIRNKFELKRFSWFDEGGGAYANAGRSWSRKFVPTPSECEQAYRLAGVPDTIDPKTFLDPDVEDRLRKIFSAVRSAGGSRMILSKRTANNRRIPQLNHAFPNARYIIILRDGRSVAHSLLRVNWWDDHVLYWNGQTPRQMVAHGVNSLDIASRNWLEEMNSMRDGLLAVPSERILEVRYDDLLSMSETVLRSALEFLGIDPDSSSGYWELIRSLGIEPRPESWPRQWSPAEVSRVESIQRDMLLATGFKLSN